MLKSRGIVCLENWAKNPQRWKEYVKVKKGIARGTGGDKKISLDSKNQHRF